MRTRSFAALAAASVLMFAACGDDDEDAGGDSTIAGLAPAATGPSAAVETSEAGAVTTVAAETTAAAAGGVDTSAPTAATSGAAAAVTSEAAAAVTTEAAAEATTEAAAATSAPEAVTTESAVEATEAGVTTSAAPEGTLEAAVVETTDGVAVSTEPGAATRQAAGTTEATGETTETTDGPTAAAAVTSEAGAGTSTPEGSAPVTSAPGSSVSAGEPGAITIGSANFYENELLAQIYGQALEAAGFDVSYEPGIGSREVYLGAIEGGEIGLIPEYTGSLLGFISDEPPTATNVEEQIAAIGEELPEGLEVLTPSSAENKDTIVCTQDVVDELGLTNLSTLFENSGEITLGAPPEFETRTPFGLEGFSTIYDAEFAEFVPLAPGDIPPALEAGEIDCGNIFSTDPAIDTGGFVSLEDDLAIVTNEAVLPLVRSELVTPELTATLEEINAALDTEILTSLGAQVVNEQLGADVVAAEFLATLGD